MVWHAEMDGSSPEVLLTGHELRQPAGLGLDVTQRKMYISDRAGRRLFRVGLDMPEGESAETRSDVEIIATLPAPAWPLNLALDLETRKVYWTDRVRGAIYAMNMDIPLGTTAQDRADIEPIVSALTEPVGIAIDDVAKRLYFTELSGRVSRSNLDGPDHETILTTASASAIAVTHLHD